MRAIRSFWLKFDLSTRMWDELKSADVFAFVFDCGCKCVSVFAISSFATVAILLRQDKQQKLLAKH